MIKEAKQRLMMEVMRKYQNTDTRIGVRWHEPLIIDGLDGTVYIEQAADVLAFLPNAEQPYSKALQNGTIRKIETAMVHSEGNPRRKILTPAEFAMVARHEQQKRNGRQNR